MPERACPVGGPGSPRHLEPLEPGLCACFSSREAPTLEDTLDLSIDSLSSSGDGVGRLPDGRVVFVPYTAPGDGVRARIVQRRARSARGRVEALIGPSRDRVDPVCPLFGSCGGCTWQHVRYETQVEAKRAILRDALERIGKLRVPEAFRFVPSPAEYGYRQRVRAVWSEGRWHFRRRRSHTLCAVERCPVLVPSLDRALREIRGAEAGRRRARKKERSAASEVEAATEWELACGSDGRVVATPAPERARASTGTLALRVGADLLEASGGGFLQASAPLLEPLVKVVLEAAGSGDDALELYAGAGPFTLGLARRFRRLVAVESSRAAAEDLRRNLARAGLPGVRVLSKTVERTLRDARLRGRAFDTLVLDPPRTGLSSEAARALLRLSFARVVYVSCDAATLARDLARWAQRGMRLVSLTGFDLMPQTPHVEAVAVLELHQAVA